MHRHVNRGHEQESSAGGEFRQHFDELAGRQLGGGKQVAQYPELGPTPCRPRRHWSEGPGYGDANEGKDRRVGDLPLIRKLNGATSGASGA